MKTDSEIQSDVAEELHRAPDVESGDIVIRVEGGIVTLAGSVPRHADKYQAECAAKRVNGVTGIANDIKVCSVFADRPSDTVIAQEAVEAISTDLPHIADHLKVVVREGHLTLEGSVEWQWQRQRIESTVRAIKGVDVVNNLIAIEPRVAPSDTNQNSVTP